MATDYANLIPSNVSRDLIRGVLEESAVLRLARTTRVPAGTTSIPVIAVMPSASFVAAHGGRKPATVIEWSAPRITPEEVAAVVAIPDDFIEDNTFPVWDEVQPLMRDAIAQAVDDAILWGIGAPASFPVGGIEAVAGAPVTGATPLEAISNAMSQVEMSGLLPTGHVAGARARPTLRLLKDDNGNLVYSQAITEGEPDRLFGLPLTSTQAFDHGTTAELLTGDWTKVVVGIRTDIRFDLSNEGVLTDEAGVVTANAFQDDLTLMRIYMRLGAAIGRPVNRDGVVTSPFALAEFTPPGGAPAGAARSTSGTRSRKSAAARKSGPAEPAEGVSGIVDEPPPAAPAKRSTAKRSTSKRSTAKRSSARSRSGGKGK